MEKDFKKKVIKPLCIYSLAFSMLLPSLTGVVEAASDLKESNTEKIVAKIAEKKKEVQEDKTEVKEAKKEVKETKAEVKEEKTKPEAKKDLEDILTEDEIQEIRTRANSLENSYFFNGNMIEELKAELRKAKVDPSVNYQEAKARLINEAIIKNTPVQKALGEDRAAPKSPKVNPMFLGNTEITGSVTMGKNQRKNKKIDITITVTVNRKAGGNEVKTVVVPYTQKSQDWSVTLDSPLVDGDTVTVTQAYGGETSNPGDPIVPEMAMKDKYKDTLKMPTGEIWIEQISSNIVNDDEQAEAIEMLKKANPDIANDIDFDPKSKKPKTKFSIDGTEHAYYEVTYTDGSTSGKIEAPNLKIKQVKDHSRGATLGSITIVDNVIKGQLAGEGPFDGIKVQLIIPLNDAVKDSYCDGGKCLTDKDTPNPVDATVNGTTGEFTYIIPNPDLKLNQAIGVTVKEPHKFKSCSKTTVIAPIPKKTEVRDPRKLTAEDKKAIDAAIRTAYTVNGVSKLPKGNPDRDGVPAVIQIDDSGNAKIFSPNDVAGDWDPNNDYKFFRKK